MSRRSGRLPTDLQPLLCFSKSSVEAASSALQLNTCCSYDSSSLPPSPVYPTDIPLLSSHYPFTHCLTQPPAQARIPWDPQATLHRKASRLSAALHLSLQSSKSSQPPHAQLCRKPSNVASPHSRPSFPDQLSRSWHNTLISSLLRTSSHSRS